MSQKKKRTRFNFPSPNLPSLAAQPSPPRLLHQPTPLAQEDDAEAGVLEEVIVTANKIGAMNIQSHSLQYSSYS